MTGKKEQGRRIAVISDTHGLLRPEVIRTVSTCEAVLHAGDVGTPEVLEALRSLAPVWAVRGNVDCDGLLQQLPQERFVTLFGFRIYMVHDKKQISPDQNRTDLVICGHSHRYEDTVCPTGRPEGRGGRHGGVLRHVGPEEERGALRHASPGNDRAANHLVTPGEERGVLRRLNPGSCGPRRFALPVTMMVLTLDEEEHRCAAERVDLISVPEKKNAKKLPTEQETDRLIRKVIREFGAGRTVAQIAAHTRAPEELVEDICRIYVTHPGVDADGIMDRMERKNL